MGWPPFLRQPAAAGTAGFDRPGFQRGMDRQPDGAGTLSPDLHRRSAGRAVFAWRRIYRPAQACKPGESARFPKCELLTSSFFWIVAALVTVALGFPYVMPFFLLITGVHHEKLFAALALAAVVAPVWAATQTVTLSVPGMTCSTCPITVKGDFQGRRRQQIDVTFETREAVVTFDDAKTSVQKLTKGNRRRGLSVQRQAVSH